MSPVPVLYFEDVEVGQIHETPAMTVTEAHASLYRGLITLERTVLNQRGEVVQEGETDLIVERRRTASA